MPNALKNIARLLRQYPRHSVLIIVFLLFAGIAEGLGVGTVMPLLSVIANPDGGTQNELTALAFTGFERLGVEPTLGAMLVVIVIGMSIKAALVLLAMSQVAIAMAYVAHNLRLTLLQALMQAKWSYFTRQPTGQLANAMTTESSGAAAAFWSATKMCTVTIQVVIYLGLALLISWEVTLGAVLTGGVLFVVLRRLIGISRRAGKQSVAAYNALIGRLVDGLSGIKSIKATASEDRLAPMLETDNTSLFAAQRRLLLSKEAMIALQEPIIVILMAVGLYFIATFWAVPFEQVIMMALLFHRTATRAGQIQSAYQQLAGAEAQYQSISDKIAHARQSREDHTGTARPKLQRAIEARNLFFAYDDKPVLLDVSFNAPVGQLTLLFGPSGAGKSTIVDLVTGLLRPQQGNILVDGVPLGEIDVRAWRREIGYVQQELFLFHDTILHNVTLNDPELSRRDAEDALRRAEAWHFIEALPAGIDTVVGERGSLLSGGQRQRIALARALVRRPRLLILDEPTTALDPQTEAEICRTLAHLKGKTTMLAISHQPRLMDYADNIYRIEDGRIHASDRPARAAQ